MTTPSGDLLRPPSPFMSQLLAEIFCSRVVCATVLARNKPDFCCEQKIIFQAAVQPVFAGRRPVQGRLSSHDKSLASGAWRPAVFRPKRLSPGTGAASIGPPENRSPLHTARFSR